MNRFISFFLIVGFLIGQPNPCDDTLFKELDTKIRVYGLDNLKEREWEYYQLKSKECDTYKSNYPSNTKTKMMKKKFKSWC